jgi:hypothetical protein
MDGMADLARSLEALPRLVNDDAWLVERGRFVSLEMRVDLGSVPYQLVFDHGRIAAVERGPAPLRAWRFAVRGDDDAWRQFWLPCPPPHYNDIFALAKRGAFRIEGDLHPLMANLLYFKAVLATPRRLADATPR